MGGRFDRIEADLRSMKADIADLKSDMKPMKWMVGFNMALTTACWQSCWRDRPAGGFAAAGAAGSPTRYIVHKGACRMTEKQVDLFLDSIVNAPLKDDRALMEFPFFCLQKSPRQRPLVYDDGKVEIEVRPGDRGIATIWDKDVLIYIASIINDRIERGLPVERTVRFNAHNLLQVTGRGSGKRAYELFLDAMFRLRSTTILTTIEAGDTKERRGFGWIETFRVLEKPEGRAAGDGRPARSR